MPRGIRQEGRVALVDFYLPHPPVGWCDWTVYVLGLQEYTCKPVPEDACPAVREAHSYFFRGYGKIQDPYPHIIAPRPEPLFSILSNIREVRGIQGDLDLSGKLVRLTGAKVSEDETRAVLVSGDSRGYWPTFDPHDVNWNQMHYDEKLLTVTDYRRIIAQDEFAFLRALGIKPAGKRPAA